jgi:tetratricopeptide (TPR) repeat protein
MSDFRDKQARDYFNSGVIKFNSMQYAEAIKDFDEAIRLDPSLWDAYYFGGKSKHALKLYDEAIKDFNKAIQLNSICSDAYYSRGTCKSTLGRYKDAIKDFDKAIQLNPTDNRAYFGKLQCQMQYQNTQNKADSDALQIKADALQDGANISEELLKNAKRHKRSANKYLFWGIISLFIIVVIIVYFAWYCDNHKINLIDMSLNQHLNLYLYILPFTLIDMWLMFQFTKNKNLEHSYRHKVSVARSLASLSNGLFNETKDTKLYGEYREYALEQYKYIYKPCENSKQKMAFAVSKGGNKSALDVTT